MTNRFDPADHKKKQGINDVQDAKPLVIDGRHPVVKRIDDRASPAFMPGNATESVDIACSPQPVSEASANTPSHALSCCSLNPMAGILDPGLIASGFRIHSRRLSGVFWAAPEAIVSRLIRCVRSGPKRPLATVPATAWQLMQAVVSNTRFPSECVVRSVRRLTLLLRPAIEFIARLDVDTQKHFGVLRAAILGTLPQVQPSLVWINPHACFRDLESGPFYRPDEVPRSCDRYRRKAA